MTQNKHSFLLYFDYKEQFELLPPEDSKELILALFDYAEDGALPADLSPAAHIAFVQMRRMIDRDMAKYTERCEKNRNSINKRWAQINTNEYECIEPNTNEYERIPTDTKHTDIDIDIDIDIKDKGLRGHSAKQNNLLDIFNKAYSAINNGDYAFSLEDTMSILALFFQEYIEHTGAIHPAISLTKAKDILKALPFCEDADNGKFIDLDADTYLELIPSYFNTTFEAGCDYRIYHFLSGNVRAVRFYADCY